MKLKIILLAFIFSIILIGCGETKTDTKEEYYDWNNGYCVDCGTKLVYTKCGSKYHYYCSHCDKDYTFDAAQSYK